MTRVRRSALRAFSLVEVVMAVGIIAFAVLATFGLFAVGTTTERDARDEQSAARLAANEFNRIRALSAVNFPSSTGYDPRYYDNGLRDLGKVSNYASAPPATAAYKISLFFVSPSPSPGPADWVVNAEVAYPAAAPSPHVLRFTTLMNQPVATPTPSPTATP